MAGSTDGSRGAWISLAPVAGDAAEGLAPGGDPVGFVRRLLAEGRSPSRTMVGGALACGDMASERGFFELDDGDAFATLHGFDTSQDALDRYAPPPGITWTPHRVDCDVLELEPAAFDLLVAGQRAHHVAELGNLFTQARRALRPGGLLFMHAWIGPPRWQIPRCNRAVATALLLALFPRRATRTTRRGTVKGWRTLRERPESSDLSQACNSLDLLPRFLENFEVVAEYRHGGLTYPMFEGLAHNIADDQSPTRRRLGLVLRLERWLTRHRIIHPLFTIAVGQPSVAAVPRTTHDGDVNGSDNSRRRLADLLDEYRRNPSPVIERELVTVRHDAFFDGTNPCGMAEWPPPIDNEDVQTPAIPEVDLAGLNVATLRSGVLGHGSLIVRGMLDPDTVDELSEAVHAALAAHDRRRHDGMPPSDEDRAWYEPLMTPPDRASVTDADRGWVRESGGVFLAESPRALAMVIDALEEAGVLDTLATHFGERPALSVKKGTLRVVPPDTNAGWHQDGAFLGAGIRAMNVWLALSHCGEDAPSLDIIARRLEHLVPPGADGAIFEWSVSDAAASRAAGPDGIASPVFAPGDAILFDQMNLHRTGARPGLTEHRLAIEAWFFAPSHYPLDQMPLLV